MILGIISSKYLLPSTFHHGPSLSSPIDVGFALATEMFVDMKNIVLSSI